jgi:hypothetical protein
MNGRQKLVCGQGRPEILSGNTNLKTVIGNPWSQIFFRIQKFSDVTKAILCIVAFCIKPLMRPGPAPHNQARLVFPQ